MDQPEDQRSEQQTDLERVRIAASEVVNRLSGTRFASKLNVQNKSLGVVLGSGLGGAADRLLKSGGVEISYSDIPGMPRTGVAGHSGRLVAGKISGCFVFFLQGRVHTYEGWDSWDVTFATRVLAELGVTRLILTNAAGGINRSFRPGDLMLIDGHLSLFQSGTIPIPKTRLDRTADHNSQLTACRLSGGIGFTGALWDRGWVQRAQSIVTPLRVHRGVYAMMPGPCYETPAEIRMLQRLGADAVGMSTVPEALTAARSGLGVLGVSCITNVAAGLSDQTLDHSEVTATANQIAAAFEDWLWEAIGCSQGST